MAIQVYHETVGLLPKIIVLPAETYRFSEEDRPDFGGYSKLLPCTAAHDSRIHAMVGKSICSGWARMDQRVETLRQLLRAEESPRSRFP
jgi:hypothetical protein